MSLSNMFLRTRTGLPSLAFQICNGLTYNSTYFNRPFSSNVKLKSDWRKFSTKNRIIIGKLRSERLCILKNFEDSRATN